MRPRSSHLVSEDLADRILGARTSDPLFVVAICGAADLGKSHLATHVADVLMRRGVGAAVLSLDSFLMARAERQERGISGYEPEACDLNRAAQSVQDLRAGRPIHVHPYDHARGACVSEAVEVDPGDVLLFEGILTLDVRFRDLLDLSIFIRTTDAQLVTWRKDADRAKRGLAPGLSEEIAASELRHYQRHVAPLRTYADCGLQVLRKWDFAWEDWA